LTNQDTVPLRVPALRRPELCQVVELSTSGTVPTVHSSRRNPRSRRIHAKLRSHGKRDNLDNHGSQPRPVARRPERFPYRRDGM
jgi:hypothetical protein